MFHRLGLHRHHHHPHACEEGAVIAAGVITSAAKAKSTAEVGAAAGAGVIVCSNTAICAWCCWRWWRASPATDTN